MNRYWLVLFILWILPSIASAQVDSLAVPADTLVSAPTDSLTAASSDTLSAESDSLFKIRPWVYHPPLNAHIVTSDSLLRWNIWPGWVYKKNRAPGVISFRMGSFGRTNTFSIFAHQPKYLELYWGNIRMNDPVTGTINWNLMPIHKISRLYEEDQGLTYQTTFHLKEYHLLKPLTKFIYSESKFEYRNLEFMLSRNFGRKTNAEISYWYRSGGGEYSNSTIKGHQIYARVSHQLTHRQKLRLTILNNSYTNGQPFGYVMENMNFFPFNRYLATPNETGASSDRSSTVISLKYNRRPEDVTQLMSDLTAGAFMRTVKRKVKYSVDTTYYSIREFGVNAQKWMRWGPLALSGAVSYNYFSNGDAKKSNLEFASWSAISTHGEVVFNPSSFIDLTVDAEFKKRSNKYNQYLIGAGIVFSVLNDIKLEAGYSLGTRMPTMQQLYWQSAEFNGNADLKNEQITEMHLKLKTDVFAHTDVGVRAQLKQVEDGIMLVDSTFANIAPYGSFSATAWFNYINKHVEFYGSATYHQFDHFLKDPASPIPLSTQPRIWFKAGFYLKGYLFNRATYVKAGFRGMFSPQPYRAAHYFPSLDFWQPKSSDRFIPGFHRLDFDLSARVRSIMVTLRYENVLDNLFQLGYFETAYYPMNQRRLIFGIKVFFRN